MKLMNYIHLVGSIDGHNVLLHYLYFIGITVHTPSGIATCRVMLLMASVDLPARAILMNMKQFNGEYSCLYCEDPGSTIPRNHLHRFWPNTSQEHVSCTHESLMLNAEEAIRKGTAVSSPLFQYSTYVSLCSTIG